MARISSGDLHGNENGSMQFTVAVRRIVDDVRASIPHLATSKKADEYAPGALHALRKLCEGEQWDLPIERPEVLEWQACFFAWFDRVKRLFSDSQRKAFHSQAEDDFRVILKHSRQMPEYFWRDQSNQRQIQISFKSAAALEAARDAADEKHPVELGSALHKYLEGCIARLVGDEIPAPNPAPQAATTDDSKSLMIRVVPEESGRISLLVGDFACFDAPEDVEQDVVITAYDVEDASRNYLQAHAPQSLPGLRFDCESSLFCVRANVEAAAVVADVLFRFAADRKLFAEYRDRTEKRKEKPRRQSRKALRKPRK